MKERYFFVLRGPTGCGKTTSALQLKRDYEAAGMTVAHLEADQFFVRNGVYEFNPERLEDAHKDCFARFQKALDDKVNIIILSNTSTRIWEFEKYVQLAAANSYPISIVNHTTYYGNDKGIGEETVRAMFSRFEYVPPTFGAFFSIREIGLLLVFVGNSFTDDIYFHTLRYLLRKTLHESSVHEVVDTWVVEETAGRNLPHIVLGAPVLGLESLECTAKLLLESQPDLPRRIVHMLSGAKGLDFTQKLYVHYSKTKRQGTSCKS
jgi:hypothetical protein